MKFTTTLLIGLFFALSQIGEAQDTPSVVDSEVTSVNELVFTEGPAYHRDGSVFYTDIQNNRILRRASGAAIADTCLRPSGRANGLMFDSKGFLVACQGNEKGGLGGRRIVRIDPISKEQTIIADKYQGGRFNSPNDLCIDKAGRIYFTDPYYSPDRSMLELDGVEGVYRVNSDGTGLVRVLDNKIVARPNGIAISQDEKTLYVVDNNPGVPQRKLWSFRLDPDGLPTGKPRELHDFGDGRGGDGMCMDSKGNLYVTAGANRKYPNQNLDNPAGVYVFSPEGKLEGVIRVPEDMVTNCCFGGSDMKTLFITAGKTLWQVRTKVEGYALWPKAE
ncbi:MAG: SMP-30/gluconolactonase/LRE family protein [Pirellulales bacterium]|nr:SMP-30/gluconolactonase/LRE family protein [Pirellulales bacterium]